MTGGRAPRQKGNREERHLVALLQAAGFAAERIPLSGSCGGRFAGDLSIPIIGRDCVAEVKCRGNGFNRLYEWLGDHDLLIVRADRREALVVVPWHFAIEIARAAERGRAR